MALIAVFLKIHEILQIFIVVSVKEAFVIKVASVLFGRSEKRDKGILTHHVVHVKCKHAILE